MYLFIFFELGKKLTFLDFSKLPVLNIKRSWCKKPRFHWLVVAYFICIPCLFSAYLRKRQAKALVHRKSQNCHHLEEQPQLKGTVPRNFKFQVFL
jgi:hypothetical protein